MPRPPLRMRATPWSRREAWTWGAERLQRAGIAPAAAALEAEVLLRHAAGLRREELLARPGIPLGEPASSAYADLIARRAGAAPVAYLVGHREFFGVDLLVDRRVLIPRPETEHLVEALVTALRSYAAPFIVEVGTGSGAVAIATARALRHARLLATDVSADALELARTNAVRCGVADRITWAQGPALDPLAGLTRDGSVDAIVSNPPYIPTSEIEYLPPDVREHEPAVALDGGPDGLDVHRPIIVDAPRYLAPGGVLALEVAAVWGQAETVAGLIAATGRFGPPRIVRDYAGMERLVVAARRHDDHHRR